MNDDEARRITQDFLDRQGEATVSRDVEATLEWCDIPCTLESMEGRVVATNAAEMRAICETFIDRLEKNLFTHIVRRCLEASFKDESTIWATYETRYVRDGTFLTETPYIGFVILRHRGDRWKISTMQFAVSSDSPANVTLKDWIAGQSEA